MARKDSKTREKAILPERRLNALKLRKSGLTYSEIASQLKCGTTTAYKDVRSMIDQLNSEALEEAENLRTLESLRLDNLQSAIWKKAIAGDIAAILAILKIIDQRCKLFGLYQLNSTNEGVKELEAIKVLIESGWLSKDLEGAIANHITDCSQKIKDIVNLN